MAYVHLFITLFRFQLHFFFGNQLIFKQNKSMEISFYELNVDILMHNELEVSSLVIYIYIYSVMLTSAFRVMINNLF